MRGAESGMAPADREIVARADVRAAMERDVAEAFRQGHRGPARDVAVIAGDWGFALREITLKVHVWHGEDDRNASFTTARHMAATLPNCEARWFPGEGHMHWLNHLGALMALVRASDAERTEVRA
jgi:pimeloyl-ACP methyl ester carboxylesterase